MLWEELRAAAVRQNEGAPEYDENLQPSRTSHVTGHLERSIFTAIVILTPPEAAFVAMATWLGLKMAASWGKPPWEGIPAALWDRHAFLALQAGVVSMAFAGAGGAIAIFVHDLLLHCL